MHRPAEKARYGTQYVATLIARDIFLCNLPEIFLRNAQSDPILLAKAKRTATLGSFFNANACGKTSPPWSA